MSFADVTQWLQQNQLVVVMVQLSLTFLVLLMFMLLNRKLKKYRFLAKGNENKDLESLLLEVSNKLNGNSDNLNDILKQIGELQENSKSCFQHWSLVRFKAFNNIGGDQSFALALMDSFGDGLVFSSIFGRENSVVYCKPIKNGSSAYPLSKEEQEAITQALSPKKNIAEQE